jgi:hypothetical protein
MLGKLAEKDGCTLLLSPDVRLEASGDSAVLCRQEELYRFLTDDSVRDVDPLIRTEPRGSLLIVGDRFCAESRVPDPGAGYEQTFFTWHAPTVLSKLKAFDEEFSALAERQSHAKEQRRTVACDQLQAIMKQTRQRIGSIQ